MTTSEIYIELLNQFKNNHDYEDYLADCQKKYQLKVYRVNTLTKTQAIQYYQFIKQKYSKGNYRPEPFLWQENERRLFIWFIICFIKLKGQKSLKNQQTWRFISDCFFSKNIKFLQYQYESILRKSTRVHWTEEEDDLLREAFIKYGQGEWNQIAKYIYFKKGSDQFKSPKNCRQRWNNHLNLKIKKDPWTDEQDYQLLNLIIQNGRKWSHIAKAMQGRRTQHQIKNRYNSLLLHSSKSKNTQQKIEGLVEMYKKKLQQSKSSFQHNIIIKQQPTEKKQQNFNLTQTSLQKQLIQSVQIYEDIQKIQKKQFLTTSGMSIVYSGNDRSFIYGHTFTEVEKLFLSTSQFFNESKDQYILSMEKSIVHTPGYQIFQDRNFSPFQKFELKYGDFKFIQNVQKSEISQSMQFLGAANLNVSQQLKQMLSSNPELFKQVKFQFQPEMKEI